MSLGRQTGAVVVLGLLLAGCGGSSSKSDGGPSGSGGSANKTDSGLSGSGCAAYAFAFCADIQACAPGLFPIFSFAGSDDCEAFYTRSCNDSLVAPHSGWTASVAEQCGRAYAYMDCTTFLGQGGIPAACLVHGGTIANGGACSTPWQCASGRCSSDTFGQCGTCVPAVALGQPCTNNDLLGGTCADNLVCAVTPASPTTQVCASPVPMGGACADPAVCPEDGYCDPATKICTKLPGVGASCGGKGIFFCDPRAQTGSLCDYTSSTCLAVTVAALGGACGTLTDSTANCSYSAVCNTVGDAGAGTCTPFDRGACTSADVCSTSSPCLDPVGCATLVCAGAVDAATAPAAAWDGLRAARLRRAPIGFAFGSRR